MSNVYKILAVDDEYMMLKGIEKLVSMYLPDFTVTCTAEDAYIALKLIKNTDIDVLITDIRMPNMDGIELVSRIRQMRPDLIVIIATGYEEFSYYQRALKQGVFAYILKPFDIKEFVYTFSKVKKQLENLSKQKKMLQISILDSLLAGNSHYDTLDYEFRSLQKEFFCERCVVLHIAIDNQQILESESSISEYSNLMKNIVILGEKFFEAYKAVFFINSIGNITAAINLGEDGNLTVIEKNCHEFVEFVSSFLFTSISIGISFVEDIHNLSKAYLKAKEICMYNYYTGYGSVNTHYNNLMYEITESSSLLVQFDKFLKEKNYDEAIKIIDKLVDDLLSATPPPAIAKKIINKLIFLTAEHQNQLEIQKLAQDQAIDKWPDNMQYNFNTLADAKEWLTSILTSLKEVNLGNISLSRVKSIKIILDYIEENYDKNITLNDAAELIFMHPVYFSKLFKKEVGVNFTEYVNRKKIEKAKEYLSTTAYKIKDIASMLGYPDEKYFYKVFKKFTGMTPNKFKNQ